MRFVLKWIQLSESSALSAASLSRVLILNWWRQMADTACYLFVPSETFSFACYLFSCALVRYSNVTAMKHESIKPLSFNSNRNIQRTYLLFLLIAISTCITHRKPRLIHNDNTSTHTGNLILFVCNN